MTFTNPNFDKYSLEGIYPGIVVRLNGQSDTFVENGFRVGLAANISYDVVVNLPSGPQMMLNVRPNHRRPADQTLIIAALPDDEIDARLRGNRWRFVIREGNYSTECAT